MPHLGGGYWPEEVLRHAGFRSLGREVRVHQRASLYCVENISLGDRVRIDDFALVVATGFLTMGRHAYAANYCYLGATAGITLEDYVTLAPGVRIFTSSEDYSGTFMTNPTMPANVLGRIQAPVVLRRHAIVGSNSVILPGCELGEGAAVGALSLVRESLEPWGIYAGVPARRIGERKQDLLQLERQLMGEGS
ncbi:MAG: acyltransferase [Magnetococcales bacterium]|nr:acyltransferase [Magnetococcales bacterium]